MSGFLWRLCRYRSTVGRKFEKGERFRMLFEDGKYYSGSVVGCLDVVLRSEDGASAAPGAAPARMPEIGVPWEAMLVRVCAHMYARAAYVMLLFCCCALAGSLGRW